ncbi:hypothetical protein [Paraburkholderia hospita]|uniref:hypothetical protein n=1 Tax=Paraburkholderia hospita TaxID=169430 RepID=UPI003ECE3EEB
MIDQCRDIPEHTTRLAAKHWSIDFDDYGVEQSLSFPLKLGGFTLDKTGKDYFPVILDATRYMVVNGPRSLGLETTGLGSSCLRVVVHTDVRVSWFSLVKTSANNIAYVAFDKNGAEIRRSSFDFDASDPLGTYRTFPLITINTKMSSLTFFEKALLVRASAVDY